LPLIVPLGVGGQVASAARAAGTVPARIPRAASVVLAKRAKNPRADVARLRLLLLLFIRYSSPLISPDYHGGGDCHAASHGVTRRKKCRAAEQRLNVVRYAACVRRKRGRLLSRSAPRQDSPVLGRFEIIVAQICNRRGFAGILFPAGRIGSAGYLDKDAARGVAGHVRRPGCAMAAYRMPTLAAGGRAVLEKVGNGLAFLPASAEACYGAFAVIPKQNYPSCVIQVLRKDNPSEEPYRDQNGIVIVETENLTVFFDQFKAVREDQLTQEKATQSILKHLVAVLDDASSSTIDKFIDDQTYRATILKALSNFSLHLISGFVSFLKKCIDETWSRSAPTGKFEGYNQNLIILLDILTSFPVNQIPPVLLQTAAYGLERVGYFIGNQKGQSYSANNTWEKRKSELTREMVKELRNIAEQHGYSHLMRLVNSIPA
jgi:hypothetical protein